MERNPFAPRLFAICALTIGMLGAAATRAVPGVSVAIIPNAVEVAPGSTFDLELWITEPGSPVNGFDAVIAWDAGALTFVPLDPLWQQEGSLLLGACGNTFHRFTSTANQANITDVILCNGVSLPGPGPIYRLRFQASNTPQLTNVQFGPGLQFYNEGLYVNPVTSFNAVVGIGVTPVGVGSEVASGLSLRIAPNPSRNGTVFTIGADRAGPLKIRVLDAKGRMVWHAEDSLATKGVRRVSWDGRASDGSRVAAGVYVVILEAEGRSITDRIALVR
jgi:hypothetical protein